MTRRPITVGLTILVLLCLGLAAIDLVTIVARPVMSLMAWMYP